MWEGKRRKWRVLLAGCLLVAGGAQAQPDRRAPAAAPDAKPRGPQAALLEFRAKNGDVQTIPGTRTEVSVDIHGLVAQAHVRQEFVNPTQQWIEARYVLPLPDSSAVYGMRIELPGRVIEGQIKEREEARIEYEAAKQEGLATGLVEQQRSHLFETRVANIPPGATVTVVLDYWQTIDYAAGTFEWRFPLTVRPRYDVQQVDDVSKLLDAGDPALASGDTQDATIRVQLEAGLAIQQPVSPSHPIQLSQKQAGSLQVSLRQEQVPLDRDFVLRWQAQPGQTPSAALFHQRLDNEDYALLMLVPPTTDAGPRLPRELVLVLDSSGSMSGAAWLGAQRAAHQALDQLQTGDRFALVDFDSAPNPYRSTSTAVSAPEISAAHDWINGLSADGGTEIEAALRVALAVPATPGFVRQVVFVTDGAVGNEGQIYAALVATRGEARIFTIGLSDAPNQAFLRKLAELGGGTSTLINQLEEVESGMRELFAQLDAPLLTQLQVDWPSLGEAYPDTLPDLYRGQPLLLVSKLSHLRGAIRVGGTLAGGHWEQTLQLNTVEADGIARLWARRKIGSLEDRITLGGDEPKLKAEIIDVALRNHLLSRYTSFVAVEKKISRPGDEALVPTEFENPPPADTLQFAQGALGWELQLLIGLLLASTGGWLLLARGRS